MIGAYRLPVRPILPLLAGTLLVLLSACSEDHAAHEADAAAEMAGGASADASNAPSPEQRARVAELASSWPAEPVYNVSFNALDPSANPAADAQQTLFDPSDPHWGLPEAEGRELVETYCAACHSLRLVMQQHMAPAAWDDTVTRMVTERGMPEMRPDIRQSIMAYLNAHFGAGG
jgi:hypothetical protein